MTKLAHVFKENCHTRLTIVVRACPFKRKICLKRKLDVFATVGLNRAACVKIKQYEYLKLMNNHHTETRCFWKVIPSSWVNTHYTLMPYSYTFHGGETFWTIGHSHLKTANLVRWHLDWYYLIYAIITCEEKMSSSLLEIDKNVSLFPQQVLRLLT